MTDFYDTKDVKANKPELECVVREIIKLDESK